MIKPLAPPTYTPPPNPPLVVKPEFRTILPSYEGLSIVPIAVLPFEPNHKIEATRIVRWGMKDVLDWLGEPVGEKPGSKVHMVLSGKTLYVSEAMFVFIASGCVGEFVGGVKDGVV